MSDQTEDEELAEGTLLSHLIELRSRLLVIAAAVIIAFVVLLPFSRDIFTLVSEPLREVLPGNAMIATAVAFNPSVGACPILISGGAVYPVPSLIKSTIDTELPVFKVEVSFAICNVTDVAVAAIPTIVIVVVKTKSTTD